MAKSTSREQNEWNKFVDSPSRPNEQASAVEVVIGGDDSEQLLTFVDTANSDYIYIGSASIGTATSASLWQIKRVNLSTTEIKIQYADSDSNFDNIWDNRASLIYGQ